MEEGIKEVCTQLHCEWIWVCRGTVFHGELATLFSSGWGGGLGDIIFTYPITLRIVLCVLVDFVSGGVVNTDFCGVRRE